MPVTAAVDIACYVLAADALLALWLAGLVRPQGAALLAVAVAATAWRAALRRAIPLSPALRRGLLGSAAVVAALDVAYVADTVAAALVRILAGALLYRLFTRRSAREAPDVVILVLGILVTAATVAPGLLTLAAIVPFVVVGTWLLMVQQVLAEAEERGGEAAVAADVGARLMRLGAIASLGTLAVAGALFFVIPRVGQAALGRPAAGRLLVGFTDRVELGAIGRLENDATVVMRVRFPAGLPAAWWPRLRWRGVVLDTFDGQRWTATPDRRADRLPARPGRFVIGPRHEGAPRLRQEITLEPLGSEVIFAAPRPVRMEVAAESIAVDDAGTIAVAASTPRLRYAVESEAEDGAPAEGLEAAARARHLQLPPLSPRLLALAAERTAGSGDAREIARRLTAFLSGPDFVYTLALERRTTLDPLEEFLLVRRTGNCEYFAAALAVMLRARGVPARVVNGFQRGEWNPYGDYLMVRLLDAHAWVEAWIDGAGWITLDPSPRGEGRGDARLPAVALYLDALRQRWSRYVIEWSLHDQVVAVLQVRRLARTGGPLSLLPGRWPPALPWPLALGVALAGLAAVVAGGRYLASRRRPSSAMPRFYRRTLRALARAGHRPQPSETAREFAARVTAALPAAAPALARLTAAYERQRFGDGAGAGDATEAADRSAADLGAVLRAAGRRRRRGVHVLAGGGEPTAGAPARGLGLDPDSSRIVRSGRPGDVRGERDDAGAAARADELR